MHGLFAKLDHEFAFFGGDSLRVIPRTRISRCGGVGSCAAAERTIRGHWSLEIGQNSSTSFPKLRTPVMSIHRFPEWVVPLSAIWSQNQMAVKTRRVATGTYGVERPSFDFKLVAEYQLHLLSVDWRWLCVGTLRGIPVNEAKDPFVYLAGGIDAA